MVSGHSVTFIVASGNQDAVVAAARVAFSHLYVRLAAELSGLDYQCELAPLCAARAQRCRRRHQDQTMPAQPEVVTDRPLPTPRTPLRLLPRR